jgi:hypothetical protein
MITFTLGIAIGMFLIPLVKEVMFQTAFKHGVLQIFKHPIDFIKEVLSRTFMGGY